LTGIEGADILIHVEEEELRARGTTLALAGVHPPVIMPWARAGVIEPMGEHNVFDSVHDALRALSDSRPEVQREPARGATP
jgi:DNA topoisomerase VI subunit B